MSNMIWCPGLPDVCQVPAYLMTVTFCGRLNGPAGRNDHEAKTHHVFIPLMRVPIRQSRTSCEASPHFLPCKVQRILAQSVGCTRHLWIRKGDKGSHCESQRSRLPSVWRAIASVCSLIWNKIGSTN